MILIDDAGKVWHRLWSVRLAVLSAILSACEFAMQYLAPAHANGSFAAAAFFVSLASGVARIVAQPALWTTKDPQ